MENIFNTIALLGFLAVAWYIIKLAKTDDKEELPTYTPPSGGPVDGPAPVTPGPGVVTPGVDLLELSGFADMTRQQILDYLKEHDAAKGLSSASKEKLIQHAVDNGLTKS